jgi:hypothetical protein
MRAQLATPLPVPSTAIYSRSDAIVAWESCREDEGPLSENIEVASSHLGIGHHPDRAADDCRSPRAARRSVAAVRASSGLAVAPGAENGSGGVV